MTSNKKQTAVQLILTKFNLLSDSDFKEWMLNNFDQLVKMEYNQILDVAMYHRDSAVSIDCIHSYINKHYGGQDA